MGLQGSLYTHSVDRSVAPFGAKQHEQKERLVNKREAVKLTKQIRQTTSDLSQLIITAFDGKIWVPMKYDSWDDYCQHELNSDYITLPREERIKTVVKLRESGLSQRAIAAALGTSQGTVQKDLAGESKNSPEPTLTCDDAPESDVLPSQRVTGRDGKSYPATNKKSGEEEAQTRRLAAENAFKAASGKDISAIKIEPREPTTLDIALEVGYEQLKRLEQMDEILFFNYTKKKEKIQI